MNVLTTATLAMSYLLQGEPELACEQSRKALAIARHGGSPSASGLAEYVYGWTTMYADPEVALAAFDESVRLARAGANDVYLAHSMVRAAVLRAPTDPARARRDLAEAVASASEVGSLVTSMSVLDYGIGVTAIAGPAEAGAAMIGFVERGDSISLNPVAGEEAVARREAIEQIGTRLGEAQFVLMTARGAQMSYEELTEWLATALAADE